MDPELATKIRVAVAWADIAAVWAQRVLALVLLVLAIAFVVTVANRTGRCNRHGD